jgi:cyanophycinase-like exopeptidase
MNFFLKGLRNVLFFLPFIACSKIAPLQSETVALVENSTSGSIGIVGDSSDVFTTTTPGVVLMGGSTDVDEAITWLLQRSGGGDVVVIRSFGGDGYNQYMYDLWPVNSVETLVIDSRQEANRPAIERKIRNAEALFIAGGDQWEYVDFWKGTKTNDAINYLINTKKAPIGGTSAGCMILGQACYDAQNGSVRSSEVLNNPYNRLVTFTTNFINIPVLSNTITDTHYDSPDRKGRQFGFMARLFQDSGYQAKGIGVQERTAVCIDEKNVATVFGRGKAFFLQSNTRAGLPEKCERQESLTWSRQKTAVRAYIIQGSKNGAGSVNLEKWGEFSGGYREWWWARNGVLNVRNP